MKAMMRFPALLMISTALWGPGGASLAAQVVEDPNALEARVWLDRGHEPVLERGDRARLYYRVSEDAFVAIFHIDTNGTARMVFPTSPQENHFARGGRDYRVLFPGSNYWYVNDDPGMGYFFLVASPEPFNFADLRYSHYDGGWDLSFVGRQVYKDPYLAMDDYVAALIPNWEVIPYGLDFTAYHVDRRYEYPRFMCYDCHGFRPYSAWNPYHYSCASFRVVIYNDPYYYPVTRYRGTRVVYVQPRRGVAHFGFKERAVGEPGTPHVVVRSSGNGTQPGLAGGTVRRAQPRPGAPTTMSPGRVNGGQPSVSRPGVSGGAVRRAAAGSSSGTQPQAIPSTRGGGNTVRQPTARTSRPVLERRPSSGSSSTTGRSTPSTTRNARPSSRVKSRGGGGLSSPSGSTSTRRMPTARSSSGSGTTSRPTARSSSGSRTTSRPAARSSGGSRTTSRPAARSSGGSKTTSRPAARSSTTRRSGGTPARKPPKKRGGGG